LQFLVIIEHGEHGSTAAAPVASEVLRTWLELKGIIPKAHLKLKVWILIYIFNEVLYIHISFYVFYSLKTDLSNFFVSIFCV
jgi:hypothetical protein